MAPALCVYVRLEAPMRAILRRRHHGKSKRIDFIGHPLHSNCTAPSKFWTPHEIKMRTIFDLAHSESHRDLDSENAQVPTRSSTFDHTRLIASELGHIAHRIRRFHGGGPNGISQTNGAGNYSEQFPRRDPRPIAKRYQDFDGDAHILRLRRPYRFDRHDMAFPMSKLQAQIGCSVERRRTFRMHSCM